jgi:3-oxoacyl-[acyl-carrier-protein] synthase-3
MKIKITGIGSYIPEKKVSNIDFNNHVFLNEDGTTLSE